MAWRDFVNKKDNYQHRSHNKNLLYVHLISVVKYRMDLLVGVLVKDIKQYIYDICVRNHWYIIRMEADRDHIHILLQYNPTDSITKIVTVIKSYSTFHLWKKYEPVLSKYFWKERTFWSNGYFAASVGNASKETVDRYIKNQG